MLSRNSKVIIQSIVTRQGSHSLPKAVATNLKFFSTSDNDKNKKPENLSSIPAEYYHEETEKERQLLEIISTLQNNKDFKGLANPKKVLSWEDIHATREAPLEPMPDPMSFGNQEESKVFTDDPEMDEKILRRRGWTDTDDELLNRLVIPELKKSLQVKSPHGTYVDNEVPLREDPSSPMNFASAAMEETTQRFERSEDFPDVPDAGPCPGKLQRRGKEGILRCGKIDLDELHFMDVMTLRQYLSEDAEILNRKATGLCAKCQRQVARTIKHARNMGLLPHIGNLDVQEFLRDDEFREETHASVRVDKTYFKTKMHNK